MGLVLIQNTTILLQQCRLPPHHLLKSIIIHVVIYECHYTETAPPSHTDSSKCISFSLRLLHMPPFFSNRVFSIPPLSHTDCYPCHVSLTQTSPHVLLFYTDYTPCHHLTQIAPHISTLSHRLLLIAPHSHTDFPMHIISYTDCPHAPSFTYTASDSPFLTQTHCSACSLFSHFYTQTAPNSSTSKNTVTLCRSLTQIVAYVSPLSNRLLCIASLLHRLLTMPPLTQSAHFAPFPHRLLLMPLSQTDCSRFSHGLLSMTPLLQTLLPIVFFFSLSSTTALVYSSNLFLYLNFPI